MNTSTKSSLFAAAELRSGASRKNPLALSISHRPCSPACSRTIGHKRERNANVEVALFGNLFVSSSFGRFSYLVCTCCSLFCGARRCVAASSKDGTNFPVSSCLRIPCSRFLAPNWGVRINQVMVEEAVALKGQLCSMVFVSGTLFLIPFAVVMEGAQVNISTPIFRAEGETGFIAIGSSASLAIFGRLSARLRFRSSGGLITGSTTRWLQQITLYECSHV